MKKNVTKRPGEQFNYSFEQIFTTRTYSDIFRVSVNHVLIPQEYKMALQAQTIENSVSQSCVSLNKRQKCFIEFLAPSRLRGELQSSVPRCRVVFNSRAISTTLAPASSRVATTARASEQWHMLPDRYIREALIEDQGNDDFLVHLFIAPWQKNSPFPAF